MAVGLNDNPPGLGLAFLAAIAVVRALTLTLRTRRQYELLLLGSLAGFVTVGALHGALEALAQAIKPAWLRSPTEVTAVACFFAAVFLCPAGVLVGAVGAVVKRLAAARTGPA